MLGTAVRCALGGTTLGLATLRSRLAACGVPVTGFPGGYLAEAGGGCVAAARSGGTVLVLRYAGPVEGRDAVLRAALAKLS